ncbi:hypothetical protein E2C01_079540 [Portunus trituberculatus]|uniref:Uncharacterized protein n=1 Tax=Portunus trituberculatus TaxID=210409 RepID=A0A5B7IJU1_PORTR|nr:hypothetical protein [Portunus trituberculatus]
MRLNKSQFSELLELVRPAIANMRKAVTPEERLAILYFRVSQNLISTFIPEVCSAIYQALKEQHLKISGNPEEWKSVAKDFFCIWNYPSCTGALDGKRVLIQKPGNSGSDYFDYKGH